MKQTLDSQRKNTNATGGFWVTVITGSSVPPGKNNRSPWKHVGVQSSMKVCSGLERQPRWFNLLYYTKCITALPRHRHEETLGRRRRDQPAIMSSQSRRRVLTRIRWIVSSSSGGFTRVISFYRTTKSVRMS